MGPVSLAALLTLTAYAQDVDRFDPSGSLAYGSGTLQGEAPWLTTQGFGGGLLASYAQSPVVAAYADGRVEDRVEALLPVSLYAGYTWRDSVRFEAFLPFYAYVDAPVTSYRGAAAGDVRLQANVPLYGDGRAFGLSVVPRVGLPTGTADALTRAGFNGGLLASLGGEVDAGLGWVVNAGVQGARASELEGVGLGSTVDGLVGAYWRASEAFRVGGEADLRAGLAKGPEGSSTTSNGHLFAQSTLPSGLGLSVGAGSGLIGGVGTPEYRAFAALTYGSAAADRDRDGLVDGDDACPADAEDLDAFQDADGCPDLDNDADGYGDYTDQCDDAAEDLDGFSDTDGCPDLDNDADGVADAEDQCPDAPGSVAGRGCADRDGDGVGDAEDPCPSDYGPPGSGGCGDADQDGVSDPMDSCRDAPKPATEDRELSDGCPKPAWLAGDRVGVDRIDFTTGGAVLRPAAKATLDAVAALLLQYPQVKRVEIQVHHDNTLPDAEATQLTQQRADAIAAHLKAKGVEPGRLLAKGYGAASPIDSNRTENGRTKNRRVELRILQQEAIPRGDRPTLTRPVPAAPVGPPAPAPAPESSPWGAAPTAEEGSPWGGLASDLDPAGPPGRLSVKIQGGSWANVYLDGRRLTKGAPFADLEVKAGVHELRVTNADQKLDHLQTIEVRNGASLNVLVPTGKGGSAAPEASPWGEAPATTPSPAPTNPFDGNYPIFPEEEEEEIAPPVEGKKKKKK